MTHTLKLTIPPGATEAAYSVVFDLICSDSGGPGCVTSTAAINDCEADLHYNGWCDRAGCTHPAPTVDDDQGIGSEEGPTCGGFDWEGEHFHLAEYGAGCRYVEWFEGVGPEVLDHVGKHPLVLETSPLALSMPDEGIVGFEIAAAKDEEHHP